MAISPGSNNKGSIDYARSPRWWHWNHPRIRGVHSYYIGNAGLMSGSSPHTRGPPGASSLVHVYDGIIPAYAGSTSCMDSPGSLSWDHPRIRGVHILSEPSMGHCVGSSPHTRGPLRTCRFVLVRIRISPAYAGSTQQDMISFRHTRDHPRIRGVHPFRRGRPQ